MQMIKCFEVMGNTDTAEGRGPMQVVARFSNESAAIKFVKSPLYARWCVMGYQSKSDLNNIHETVITILDTCDELERERCEKLKASAISKLTKEEREALGL
jgi:hypothetical protein